MAYSSKPPGFVARQTLIGICILAVVAIIISAIDELGIGVEIIRTFRLMIT